MRRDMAGGQPSLGRLLANGLLRLGRQARLSRGQAAALVLCLAGAVEIGALLKPRGPAGDDAAPPSASLAADVGEAGRFDRRAASADPSSLPGAGATVVDQLPAPGPATVAVALDRLAAEINAMNERLDAAVAREKDARDPVAAPRAAASRTIPAASGHDASPTAAAAPPRAARSAPELGAAARAVRRASPARARTSAARHASLPVVPAGRVTLRPGRHARRARDPLLASVRSLLGRLRLPF